MTTAALLRMAFTARFERVRRVVLEIKKVERRDLCWQRREPCCSAIEFGMKIVGEYSLTFSNKTASSDSGPPHRYRDHSNC
jgi:hypothetical protein